MTSSPLMRSASVIAARSVQRPWLSAQMPSPGVASGVSAALLTVMVMPSPAAARGRTMAGALKEASRRPCAAAVACRSRLLTQPSPSASPGRPAEAEQSRPVWRACVQPARARSRSRRSMRPSASSSPTCAEAARGARGAARAAGARSSRGALPTASEPVALSTASPRAWPERSARLSMATDSASCPARRGRMTRSRLTAPWAAARS